MTRKKKINHTRWLLFFAFLGGFSWRAPASVSAQMNYPRRCVICHLGRIPWLGDDGLRFTLLLQCCFDFGCLYFCLNLTPTKVSQVKIAHNFVNKVDIKKTIWVNKVDFQNKVEANKGEIW